MHSKGSFTHLIRRRTVPLEPYGAGSGVKEGQEPAYIAEYDVFTTNG